MFSINLSVKDKGMMLYQDCMKTPLSPTHLFENGRLCFPYGACVEVKEVHPAEAPADMQLQQEKKKLLYSLCEVCNIQLNSAAQAQVHYNGKSHLKRVKQLNNGEVPPASTTAPPMPTLTSSSSLSSLTSISSAPAIGTTGLFQCSSESPARFAAAAKTTWRLFSPVAMETLRLPAGGWRRNSKRCAGQRRGGGVSGCQSHVKAVMR
ncbi:hypothetical protein ACEWY4_023143 [Coilia grayii]|uniref:U1-type domain-containing protein n=1 Tax=Coilia grayii TaxID=363190 RepID=A0ABD1J2A1_9TELE